MSLQATVKKLNTYINDSNRYNEGKKCLVVFSNVYYIINNSIHIYLSTKHLNTNYYTLTWEIKKNENYKSAFFFPLYKAVFKKVFRCLVTHFQATCYRNTQNTGKHY